MANCKSCRATVLWVTLTSGKRNPLDPTPTPTGNIRLVGKSEWTQDAEVLAGEALERAREKGELLYTSHFATCPDAKQHRGPR